MKPALAAAIGIGAFLLISTKIDAKDSSRHIDACKIRALPQDASSRSLLKSRLVGQIIANERFMAIIDSVKPYKDFDHVTSSKDGRKAYDDALRSTGCAKAIIDRL